MAVKKNTGITLTRDGKARLTPIMGAGVASTRKNTQTSNDIDRYLNDGKAVGTDTPKQSESLDDLDRYYSAVQEQLDVAKRTAQQDASIALDTLNKYLPIQNKMNGLNSLGVSESASIDAYNKYIGNMGTIEQTHAADSAALLENYMTAKKDEQDAVYQEYMSMLESGLYNSTEDLDRYLKAASGNVSDTQLAQIENYVKYIKNNPDQMAELAQRAAQSEQSTVKQNGVSFYENDDGDYGFDAGDDFTLRDANGRTYSIESRGAINDSAPSAAAAGVANNSIFAYGGKIYYKINGTLYEVGGRKGSNTTDDYTALYNHFYGNPTEQQNTSDGVIVLSTGDDSDKSKTESNYTNFEKIALEFQKNKNSGITFEDLVEAYKKHQSSLTKH